MKQQKDESKIRCVCVIIQLKIWNLDSRNLPFNTISINFIYKILFLID